MSVNKLALMRYKVIDECLKNRYRKWTLDDLIIKVADALYDHEGITTGVSKRTIQADIQLMRSDKLGYNAPIVIQDRKFYAYSDAAYSITQVPINNADIEKMKDIVGLLKQFNGFSYFEDMSDMIARLENNLNKTTNRTGNCIQLEQNTLVKGLEHITPLYNAILHRKPLLIEYKSFKAEKPQQQIYHPYLLKEHRNRWFLIARNRNSPLLVTLALDRIIDFQQLGKEVFLPYEGIGLDRYYSELLGVTRSERDRPMKVRLLVNSAHAPYVLTKPLHPSQKVIKEDAQGTTIRIDVVLNFELEKEILSFGEHMTVIAPRLLANKIKRRVEQSARHYAQP